MLINVYKSNEEIQNIDIKKLNSYLSQDYKSLIYVTKKEEFDESLELLKIKSLIEDHNNYDVLTTLNNLIIFSFKFFYFENQKERSCNIKIILSNDFLLIFNKKDDKFFSKILLDVLNQKNKINLGTILHSLLNFILNYYLSVLDQWGEEIALVETLILKEELEKESYVRLSNLRARIIHLKRALKGQVDHLRDFVAMEHEVINASLKFSFKVTYEKALDLTKTLEKMNDIILNVYSLYLATVSIQQNETMKVLTSIAAIFMPITFITGFFGMNVVIPFAHYPSAFYFSVIFMGVITLGVFLYFRRKNWI